MSEVMMQSDHKEQRDVCYFILSYLTRHPDAGDTFDGIVEWWLLEQRIRFETRNVSEAVARLVAEELILEHVGPDSRVTYRVNRTREQAIRNMLSRACIAHLD
jgi:hypothetical protein